MQALRERIEQVLEEALNDKQTPDRLLKAMRYSTLSGGKRFRALLVYGAGAVVNAPIEKLDAVAAAIECVHAYSLIHDDLPAMDDDDLRRGRATSHIEFDEATAILAGDALLTLAFQLINQSPLNNEQARIISGNLAVGAGQTGMVGGQMQDIQATEKKLKLEQLEDIHRRKTGALINTSVICGALCGEKPSQTLLHQLNIYANKLGLAFQVIDDILDIEGSTEILGKRKGSDIQRGKATYPALLGLPESKKLAETLYREAIESIDRIGDNSQSPDATALQESTLLRELAELVVKRKN